MWHLGHLSLRDHTGVLLQYARIWLSVPHFITHVRGTRIIITSDLISEMLHILRVEFTDYPSYEHLRIVSKDELLSHFCETHSSWGDRQNTPCSGLAKGSRFLNMVMTFIFHPLSHYNSIIEPCAWFLLSLLEGLTIDFPFHFILSLIDVYRDTATRDKLIFPSTITRRIRLPRRFSAIFLSPILNLYTFLLCVS